MKVSELKEVAESFAVDHSESKNKAELLALLTEEGVTFEMYKEFAPTEDTEEVEEPVIEKKVSAKKKQEKETVLIKMDRNNTLYETCGVEFTAEHPFAVVDIDTAQFIFNNEQGFRMATPYEIQEFYS
jgi:hypothetical protein